MHLRLRLNLLHFLPDLGVLYGLSRAPSFYEIHPLEKNSWEKLNKNIQLLEKPTKINIYMH
jgi:hypothetical protein